MNILGRFGFESATKKHWWIFFLPVLLISSNLRAEDRDVDFSQAELDQILAPIALYPDTLLSQVLMAATYPIEVVQANRWASTHKELKGEDAVKAVESKDWDPSVKALVAFPDILDRMSDDLDWTQKLGDAFLSDERAVMDTVQGLRRKANSSGSLKQIKHLRVDRDDDDIIIEPAEERVVYVPVYDTRVVYGPWWWPEYQPVYWSYPSSYVFVGGFYWGPRAYIGPTYFYSSCHWRDRRLVVVDYRSRPSSSVSFYTSRSIIGYSGAREWHHDPIHRHGVAYYNDRLSVTYGSHRNSYRNDHDYREHRFDREYLDRHPELNRSRNNGVQFNQGIEHRDDHRNHDDHDNNAWRRDVDRHDADIEVKRATDRHILGNSDADDDRHDRNNRNDWNRNNSRDSNDQPQNNNWQHRLQNDAQPNTNRPAWQSNGQPERMRAGSDHASEQTALPGASMESNNNAARSQFRQMQQQEQRRNDDQQDAKPRAEVHVDNQINRRIEGRKDDRRGQPRRGRDDKDD